MTPEAAATLDDFFRRFAPARNPLLLLDYDGTLAPFRADRFQAAPWPGVRELLQSIQDRKTTRMVVVSGRPATEIAPLLGLRAPLEVWGLHGFERLHPDGRRERQQIPPAVEEQLHAVQAELRQDGLGGLFEEKPNAAVMHWRGVSSEEAARIEQRTRARFAPLAKMAGFKLLPFEAGLELRVGREKDAAVEALLSECGDCAPVAYLGDDITDEAAFSALKGRGLSVLVRSEPRQTAADIWLRPPRELLEFLARWLEL